MIRAPKKNTIHTLSRNWFHKLWLLGRHYYEATSKRRASKDSYYSYPKIQLELQPVRCAGVMWLFFLNQTPTFDWCVVR